MDLDELRAFVAVAETGSMAKAARRLGFARATLRRRVDELEARIGAPLLERSSKGVRLTPAGERLVRGGRTILEETSLVLAETRSLAADPAGMLHVLLPLGLPPHAVAIAVELLSSHPGLSFQYRFASDPLRSLLEGVDVVVFFGRDEDSPGRAWITHELGRAPQRLLASPAYLERRGRPREPADLADHALLLWQPPGPPVRRATVGGVPIDADPLVISPHIEHLLAMAGRGLGVACVPEGGLDLGHLGGPLEVVLPEVDGPTYRICLSAPRALAAQAKVQAVLGFSEQTLQLVLAG